MSGQFPDTFYRVAVKALIKDKSGKLLVIKEKSDKWDLPGGGLDHGEEPVDGIKRELQEELGIDGAYVGEIVKIKSFWLDDKQSWLMWVVYEVTLSEDIKLKHGDGVTHADYIEPGIFKTSQDEREQYLSVFAD